MFNESKVTQAAVYFFYRSGEESIPYIKLVKLLYLADRESFKQYGYSISGDAYYSLPQGPILSKTLDIIKGKTTSRSIWQRWLITEDYSTRLQQAIPSLEDLDELSEATIEILDKVWETFGHRNKWDLVDNYQHDPNKTPEWKNPGKGSLPLPEKDILSAVGWQPEAIQAMQESTKETEAIESVFVQLRNHALKNSFQNKKAISQGVSLQS